MNDEKIKKEIYATRSFEEIRIAILENSRLAELLWERSTHTSLVGNIYKGKVENVLPGISSAFIDIGYEKNAYIYVSDVVGNTKGGIDKVLKENDEVMVQITKDAISTKGMKVTMDINIPGRFIVLAPFQRDINISRNIERKYYDGKMPLFKAFNIEHEIEEIWKMKVDLPSGGSIIIQEAESLCAIDVNTGRYTGLDSQEETVTQTNIEAAYEIARQIRLRNIGGIIVIDFIDMKKPSNRYKVVKA
mgnify:CR=1 FL=1